MNLPTWDPPLPCLSSRFSCGTQITREKVSRVASAEEFLINPRIRQLRVREHDNIGRIEVPHADMLMFLDKKISKKIMEKFKAMGYIYVTLDSRVTGLAA